MRRLRRGRHRPAAHPAMEPAPAVERGGALSGVGERPDSQRRIVARVQLERRFGIGNRTSKVRQLIAGRRPGHECRRRGLRRRIQPERLIEVGGCAAPVAACDMGACALDQREPADSEPPGSWPGSSLSAASESAIAPAESDILIAEVGPARECMQPRHAMSNPIRQPGRGRTPRGSSRRAPCRHLRAREMRSHRPDRSGSLRCNRPRRHHGPAWPHDAAPRTAKASAICGSRRIASSQSAMARSGFCFVRCR